MRSLNGRFSDIEEWLTLMLARAPVVEVGEWQAQRTGLPQESTIEVEDVSFEIPLPGVDVTQFQMAIRPNLPWAEDHFQERVSGIPHNPPPSHEWWPFAQKHNEQHRKEEKFSHTYPERFWPSYAGETIEAARGIRFRYGDLSDLLEILQTRPGTRQAYLPVWFPEDLAASGQGERVPCTLGYHFLIRSGELKIVYYIRSCDFFRHFRDDVYMAGRLAQWVASRLSSMKSLVTPSKLVMHISSLHIFSVERAKIEGLAKEVYGKNMTESSR